MRTIERMERAFEIYLNVRRTSDYHYRNRPQGIWGISEGEDYNAKQWQRLRYWSLQPICYGSKL